MVFIQSIHENDKGEDFLILLQDGSKTSLVINKFDEPILVRMDDLDEFVQSFFVKEELIDWVCSHLTEFQQHPEILKLLLKKISVPKNIEHYTYHDGTTKTELFGGKHCIEVWQDDFGSLVKIKDKRNRILAKVSIYEEKILTSAVRNQNDKTKFILLYPRRKDRIEMDADDIQHWRDSHEDRNKNKLKK